MNKLPLVLVLALACTSAMAQKSLPGDETMTLEERELAYLVTLCEGCHGPDGVSQRDDVPGLAGRPSDELFAEIEKFYFYERLCPDVPVEEGDKSKGHMSMCDVTSQLNKAEAQQLAQYFESKKASSTP